MHLIEIFLPSRITMVEHLKKTCSTTFSANCLSALAAPPHAPAKGIWKDGREKAHDDIVIMQVMTDNLDRVWWQDYREALQGRLRQDEILVRSTACEKI